MGSVSVTVGLQTAAVSKKVGHPHAYLLSESGAKVQFRWIKVESTRGGFVGKWAETDRPGLKPLNRRTNLDLLEQSFEATIGGVDPQVSCEALLARLAGIAKSGRRVRLSYSAVGEAGWWNITDLSVAVTARTSPGNHAARATVTFTLKESNSQTPVKAHNWRRQVTVRKGDTLYKLAARWLRRGSRWKEIAAANGIRNPKSTTRLKPGSKIWVPAS